MEDGVPEWLRFDYSISRKWKVRVGFLSLGAFVSIFSGTFVSTTPGANFGCGVDGLPDSWPLCNGKIVDSVEDIIAQSQIIHRWFVGLMLIALIFASYSISNEQSGNNILRNWIWGSTFLFFVNTSIGAIYVLSWDLEEGFFEFLSLVHLMMASLTFVTMAVSWIGCSIAEDG
tara:strand:+ start:40 stop:558 length:519 start_codon:yes stop_codon:yes gene_type:complete